MTSSANPMRAPELAEVDSGKGVLGGKIEELILHWSERADLVSNGVCNDDCLGTTWVL